MAEPALPRAHETAEYQPLSRRRRLLIVGLAVAMAWTVGWLILEPPGGVQRPRVAPGVLPDTARCSQGQTTGCVGGKAMVIVPATAAASGPAAGSMAGPAAPAASR